VKRKDDDNNRRQPVLDLTEDFPISKRLAIKNTLPWVLTTLLFFFILVFSDTNITDSFRKLVIDFGISRPEALILIAGIVVCTIKLIYERIRTRQYYYAIRGKTLVISRGIFLKVRDNFPLSGITEVYTDRSFMDFLFGLKRLNVAAATAHYATIEGLKTNMAFALQDKLTAILEKHHEAKKRIETVPSKRNKPSFSRVKHQRLKRLKELQEIQH